MVHPIAAQFAPAPGPTTQTLVVPRTTTVVAPAPVITASGAVATAPTPQTVVTPTLVTVPTVAPATAPTTHAQVENTPSYSAPSSSC